MVVGQRLRAILVAAFVPAVIGATHDLALGNRIEISYSIFLTAGVLLLLLALTATFDFCMRRGVGNARCFLLSTGVAVTVAVGESFTGWGIERVFGVPLVAP